MQRPKVLPVIDKMNNDKDRKDQLNCVRHIKASLICLPFESHQAPSENHRNQFNRPGLKREEQNRALFPGFIHSPCQIQPQISTHDNKNQHLFLKSQGTETTHPDIMGQAIFTKQETGDKDLSAKLKHMVLKQHIFQWRIIAEKLNCSKQKAIKLWRKNVFPSFCLKTRVAGSTKWAPEEDHILFSYVKQNGLDLEAIWVFLPTRTTFSIQGRWRRICKDNETVKVMTDKLKKIEDAPKRFMVKYEYKKYIIKQIARHMEQTEKLTHL